MMKILSAIDLTELKLFGYSINMKLSNGKIHKNSEWINPHTFWNCEISNKKKQVIASFYKYIEPKERQSS